MAKRFWLILVLSGVFLGTACSEGSSDPVAATRQAIAFVLTYQAENPRLTETPWPGGATLRAILTRQAQVVLEETPTVTPSITPRPVGTPAPEAILTIPAGAAPTLDGQLAPGEWDEAGRASVVTTAGTITVHAQWGAAALYVAFDQLDQGEAAFFPEVYVDAAGNRGDAWDDDDWWFHRSTQQCQGVGLYALWAVCGGEQAWQTTTFVDSGRTIEMAIPFATLSVPAGANDIGLAFAVMSLTETGAANRAFWPVQVSISQPSTWGVGVLAGAD